MHRRTSVLRLVISLVFLAALLVSCAPPVVETTQEAPTVAAEPTKAEVMSSTATLSPTLPPPAQYSEAPELAQQVKDGTLPPVEERLPESPMVVQPNESIGVYGGVMHRLTKPSGDGAHFTRVVVYEGMVRWTPDWTGLEPDVAESYEVNDNATEYTFHLRKGMKWSDGSPYTSADIKFWYEDIILNTDLNSCSAYLVKGRWGVGQDGIP